MSRAANGNQKILRVKLAACAEPAADVVFHHADRSPATHHLRQRAAIGERHFGDAGYCHALLLGVPLGKKPARFHRYCGMPLHAKVLAPDVGRVLERRFGVAAHGRYGTREIGPCVLEENNFVLAGRIAIGHRRMRLNIDRDRFQARLRRVPRCRP